MKIFIKKSLIFIYLIFILNIYVNKASSEYLILADPWPPWTASYYGPAESGIAVDTIQLILKKSGLKAVVYLHPWKRVVRMVEYQQADGILMIQKSQNIPFIKATDTIFKSREVFCYNPMKLHDFDWKSFDDIKKYKIGTIIGYYYGNFSEAIKKFSINTEPAKNLESNIKKLLLGRVDLVVCDYYVLLKLFSENPEYAKRLKIHQKSVHEWQYSFGISKYSELSKHINKINMTIQNLKKTDSIRPILKKYGLNEEILQD